MSDEQLLVTLGISDKGAATQIKALNQELKYLDTQYKATSQGSKNFENTSEGLRAKLAYLEKSYETNKTKLEAYRKKQEETQTLLAKKQEELAKLNTAEGDNAKAIEKTQRQIDSYSNTLLSTNRNINLTETQLSNLDRQITETEKAFKSQSATDYSKNITKLGTSLTTTGDKITGVGKNLSILTAGITGAGAAAMSSYKSVKEGTDAVIKATGATGQAADDLKATFKDIASNSAADFTTIGNALGAVTVRFGFTGQASEDATNQFIKFAKINNVDVAESVQKVARAMGDAGIDSSKYSEVLDTLTVASQKSGIGIDALTEDITKYGAPMRALGFDTQESIALFSSWEKAGVNVEISLAGMKKAISNWGAAGKDSRVEFAKTLEDIKACPDIASATSKAIDIFGQKAGLKFRLEAIAIWV